MFEVLLNTPSFLLTSLKIVGRPKASTSGASLSQQPPCRLTGVEIHWRLFMVSLVAVRVVTVTFPVIVDHEHSKQDDGDNLQNQGQDGELHPHVGGICRHPETSFCYLSQSVTHTHIHTHQLCLSIPPYQSFLGVVLCEGREESVVWF